MFGLGRKRKNENEEKGLDKPKAKKVEKDQGSPWASLVMMAITVLVGAFFWIYGILSNGGVIGVNFRSDEVSKSEVKAKPQQDGSGVIIFEK